MAATIITDTLTFTKTMEAAGMPGAQAEAIALGLNEHAIEVATTHDIERLRNELVSSELRIKLWMVTSQLASTAVILGVIAKAHGWL
ncbi:MAG: hypothetical protein ACR2RL_21670 [Gammaproteobacteria bacterium]